MGYDVVFQVVDDGAMRALFEALAKGEPRPPSAFDSHPRADELWQGARDALAGSEPVVATAAVARLIVNFAAARWPHVRCRNLAVTTNPLHQEEAFADLPTDHWKAGAAWWLEPLGREDIAFSGALEGNHCLGGVVEAPEEASNQLKAFGKTLDTSLEERWLPILAILRAAWRMGGTVLESADLLDVESAPAPLTHVSWRTPPETPTRGDVDDIVDQLLGLDADDETRAAALWIASMDWAVSGFGAEADRLLPWMERALHDQPGVEVLWEAYHQLARAHRDGRTAGIRPYPDADVVAGAATLGDNPRWASAVFEWYPPLGEQPLSREVAQALMSSYVRARPAPDTYAASAVVAALVEAGATLDPLWVLADGGPPGSRSGLRVLWEVLEEAYLLGKAFALDEHVETLVTGIESFLAKASSDTELDDAQYAVETLFEQDQAEEPAMKPWLQRAWTALHHASPERAESIDNPMPVQ